MRINVSRQNPPHLDGADDFTRLEVVPLDMAPAEAGDHLGELGMADGPDHVRLVISALRKLLVATSGVDSAERFDKMIKYAAGKGWVDDQNRVRVHIEAAQQGARR